MRTTGTNRVASITTSGSSAGTRSFTHDARGNFSAETRPAVNVATAYDGYGRLISHSQSGEATLVFAYNGMDDRISTSESALIKRYVYDGLGRVIGEYGATATAVRGEYIYLMPDGASDGSSPFGGDDGMGGYGLLAVMTPDGLGAGNTVPHYVHSNHLGAPMFSTDAAGQIITPGQYAQPVFPGQLQTRADLYYNRYRDYDPTTGRYLQADPIGLAGGANSYGYANANSMRYTDPDGLIAIPAAYAVGAGVVALGTAAYLWWNEYNEHAVPAPYRWPGRRFCIGGGRDHGSDGADEGFFSSIYIGDYDPNDGDPQCRKASKQDLKRAGIFDEHKYKIEHGAKPTSRYDICVCRGGIIRIAAMGQCGKTRHFWN